MQKGTGWKTHKHIPQLKLRIKGGWAVPWLCRKTDDLSLRTGEEQIGPEVRERIHVCYVQRLLLPPGPRGQGSSFPFFLQMGLYSLQGALAHPFFVGSVPEYRVCVSHNTLVIHGLYLWLSCFIPAFAQQETTGRC